jgi:molybdenum cofactor cytidylyltransferase
MLSMPPMAPETRTDFIPIPAVVLAAGASTRLGQPKQLLRWPAFGGETLIDRTIGLAREAGAEPIFVVLGAHAEEIRLQAELRDCILVRNEAWAEGMASSIRLGISTVLENAPDAFGAMMLVCDQPALSADHLRALLNAHRSDPKTVAASRYAGRAGVPAIFPRALFSALQKLHGDRGARAILQQPDWAIHTIEFPGGELDLDSPEDVARSGLQL